MFVESEMYSSAYPSASSVNEQFDRPRLLNRFRRFQVPINAATARCVMASGEQNWIAGSFQRVSCPQIDRQTQEPFDAGREFRLGLVIKRMSSSSGYSPSAAAPG